MANKRQAKKAKKQQARNKTLEQLFSADINKMTKQDIKSYYKTARENVRKSMKYWEKQEYKSPAYYAYAKKTGGRDKVQFRGKDTLQKLKHELKLARDFLMDDTRSMDATKHTQGWTKIKKDNIQTLLEKTGIELSLEEYDKFYSSYEKAKEMNKNVARMEYKYQLMDTLLDEMRDDPNLDKDELALKIAELAPAAAKENEGKHLEALKDVSDDFF